MPSKRMMSKVLTDNLYLVFTSQPLFNGFMGFRVQVYILILLVFFSFDYSFAGRRAFIQTQDTELLAAGDIELESWVWIKESSKVATVGWLWISPVISLTNSLEFSFPWELNFTETGTQITNTNLEFKYLLTDPLSDADWRAAIKIIFEKTFKHPKEPNSNWQNFSLIQSYGDVKADHWTLELGGYGNWFNKGSFNYAYTNLGYAQKVTNSYRLGLEYLGEYPVGLVDQKKDTHMFGPDLSYAKGSAWLTMGYLFGLNDNSPSVIYRLVCGAVF